MLRILFLGLILMISPVFSLPKMFDSLFKFAEVEENQQSKLKKISIDFQDELDKEKNYVGLIINFGKKKEINKREKIIKKALAIKGFVPSKIVLIKREFTDETKTVFYFVPADVKLPTQ